MSREAEVWIASDHRPSLRQSLHYITRHNTTAGYPRKPIIPRVEFKPRRTPTLRNIHLPRCRRLHSQSHRGQVSNAPAKPAKLHHDIHSTQQSSGGQPRTATSGMRRERRMVFGVKASHAICFSEVLRCVDKKAKRNGEKRHVPPTSGQI